MSPNVQQVLIALFLMFFAVGFVVGLWFARADEALRHGEKVKR